MSLDVYLHAVRRTMVWEYNITHNLGSMAGAAGLYLPLWRPETIPIEKAEELIPRLEAGLERLKAEPERFRALNPSNGWGNYENLVEFVAKYLDACRENPDAEVEASR